MSLESCEGKVHPDAAKVVSRHPTISQRLEHLSDDFRSFHT
jgi:hypothetical protein